MRTILTLVGLILLIVATTVGCGLKDDLYLPGPDDVAESDTATTADPDDTSETMMQRTPEPELMDAPAQAMAYAEADFNEPNQLFVDHFLECVDERQTGSAIDLGCGPGDICIRLVRALPGWHLVGLDAGPNMLALAEKAVAAAGLKSSIELILAHLPHELPTGHFDAVVSNSLLHHLPDPQSLWQSIRELAGRGCRVQVMDLRRPGSAEEAAHIVATHAKDAPEVLRQDFYNSLHAAYTTTEVAEQIEQAGLRGLTISTPTERHWLVQGRIVS